MAVAPAQSRRPPRRGLSPKRPRRSPPHCPQRSKNFATSRTGTNKYITPFNETTGNYPANLPPPAPDCRARQPSAPSGPLQKAGGIFLKDKKKAKANPGLFTLHTSSSPLCRCTARKTWSPSRGSNNKYFPMQETQCDKFGVSGGLGEPRFGLKLWLGSADLIDDNSSKSWVLFRDLPYLAIVMGVDLCMFMSVGIALDKQKNPLERRVAGECVCRRLGATDFKREREGRGREGGYVEKELEAPKWAPPGTLSAPSPAPGGPRSAATRVLLLPQSRQRFAESSHF